MTKYVTVIDEIDDEGSLVERLDIKVFDNGADAYERRQRAVFKYADYDGIDCNIYKVDTDDTCEAAAMVKRGEGKLYDHGGKDVIMEARIDKALKQTKKRRHRLN